MTLPTDDDDTLFPDCKEFCGEWMKKVKKAKLSCKVPTKQYAEAIEKLDKSNYLPWLSWYTHAKLALFVQDRVKFMRKHYKKRFPRKSDKKTFPNSKITCREWIKNVKKSKCQICNGEITQYIEAYSQFGWYYFSFCLIYNSTLNRCINL